MNAPINFTALKMPKFKSYEKTENGCLSGTYMVTVKLDGVCVLLDSTIKQANSKHGKPLYNFDEVFESSPPLRGKFEVFRKDWDTTVSLVRTQHGGDKVKVEELFQICPPDERLVLFDSVTNPTHDQLFSWMMRKIKHGNEGMVLYRLDKPGKPVKVKPKITVDIRVKGLKPGTGKHLGRLGAFLTDYGNVGTGMSDAQREEFNTESMVGAIIEVEAMEWTKDKKLRHPRFKRHRWDKDTENLEERISL